MTPRRAIAGRPLRAIGYVRVSSQQQADSRLSLEHQEQKIRAAAELHDLALQDVIVDAAESAASLDRPGIARVLTMARRRQLDAVVILKLDRLTRNVRDLADLLALFRGRKVALISVSESLNTDTASGRMVVQLLGVIAEWEREAIGERTSAALHAKRLRGEVFSGRPPYGFIVARAASGTAILRPVPAEQRMMALAADCREAGFSWQQTADELTRRRYAQRNSRAWSLHAVRSALRTYEKHAGQLLDVARAV